jgi:hypothetical protein
VLKSLRALDAQSDGTRHFNLDPLDHLILDNDTFKDGMRRSDQKPTVIELCSEDPGTGKTHLLYLITILAILPSIHHDVDLDGKESTVIIIDTEGRFSVERVVELMEHYIIDKDADTVDMEDLISRSLEHLHIFRPQSMTAMIATLSNLPTYLLNHGAHQSTRRPVHSVMIDSVSTFYWQTREEEETTKVTSLKQHSGPSTATMNPYATLTQVLSSLYLTFSCAIIATTHGSFTNAKESGPPTLRTLPAPWANFPSVRLLFTRETVQKFAHGMSVEEAMKEQANRQSVVERVKFCANVIGSKEAFKFSILKKSVVIEVD